MKLEWNKYYVAKISYFKNNPIHEVIINVKLDEIVVVFNGTDCEEVRVKDLNYFEVVNEIKICK
ncbi:hypothetical protein [Romboutsia sp.]|uniref:hypothetical protein n=1 Tax=Romboutsia sp. TaxID=1965302 RepID=UPI002CDDA965|nr:hypothetical protein [Romboutsia sp.]HSQ90177.1 hypothetical protein [Romboutsia sp.]